MVVVDYLLLKSIIMTLLSGNTIANVCLFSIALFLNSIPVVDGAGGDCMSGTVIDCFECNTWEDERCNDPFNYTLHKEHMPPLRACEGCCVKMVQFIGTKHYQIKRTCTEDFEVNFFMVNHACMTEGHRHGRMCFCEEDGCNAAKSMNSIQFPLWLFFLLISWLPTLTLHS